MVLEKTAGPNRRRQTNKVLCEVRTIDALGGYMRCGLALCYLQGKGP